MIRNKFVNFVELPFTCRVFSCKIMQMKTPIEIEAIL